MKIEYAKGGAKLQTPPQDRVNTFYYFYLDNILVSEDTHVIKLNT